MKEEITVSVCQLAKENFICIREDERFMPARHIATIMLMAEWQERFPGGEPLTPRIIEDILGYVGYRGACYNAKWSKSFISYKTALNICKELVQLGLFTITKERHYKLVENYEDIIKSSDKIIYDRDKYNSKFCVAMKEISAKLVELMDNVRNELKNKGSKRKYMKISNDNSDISIAAEILLVIKSAANLVQLVDASLKEPLEPVKKEEKEDLDDRIMYKNLITLRR